MALPASSEGETPTLLPRRSALALPALVSAVALPRRGASQAGGGVLRIAMSASLRNLDPANTTIGEKFMHAVLCFNGLTRMKEDQSVEPELAESWTYSDDLKTWNFKLRRGVKFHHGREMTADDVITTYRRILDPATGSASRRNYEMIEAMEAPDAHTVIFRLSYPYGGFADILSDRQVKIIPTDQIDDLATRPIGTGPFADVRLRRALHLAVPKPDVAEVVLFGEGAPTHCPIAPNHPFFASDVPFPARADVDGARRLLREAGHANGLRVPLVIPVGRPVRERLAVTLQQMARPLAAPDVGR